MSIINEHDLNQIKLPSGVTGYKSFEGSQCGNLTFVSVLWSDEE